MTESNLSVSNNSWNPANKGFWGTNPEKRLRKANILFITAIIGVWYARYEGFNTLRSAMLQLTKNEMPVYEIISGAALAFAALLLILPGFATDFLGLLIIFPPTRKLFLRKIPNKNPKNTVINSKDNTIKNVFKIAS